MVVAGLLFLAFAYFAVGQASMKKNEARTAADAAALAAAQDARDEWSWPGAFDFDAWDDLLSSRDIKLGSCSAADRLAAANDARTVTCDADYWPEASYTVKVETNRTVGSSVIASTKTQKAEATARAVIEPRCRIEEDTRPTPSPRRMTTTATRTSPRSRRRTKPSAMTKTWTSISTRRTSTSCRTWQTCSPSTWPTSK